MSTTVGITVSARGRSASTPTSYLGLFTVESWREFLRNGGSTMGFNSGKLSAVQKLRPGDRILCYLTKVSAFIGILEVTGPHFHDESPLWSDGVFPLRLPVRVMTSVPMTHAVPIRTLRGKLTFLPKGEASNGWTAHVRSSPRRWCAADASAVRRALETMAKKASTHQLNGEVAEPQRRRGHIKPRIPTSARVGRLIAKSNAVSATDGEQCLGSYETALSFNKVTGYSVNFPIAETCRPTGTCMKTCYFAAGAPSWTNALRHQHRVLATARADPVRFAERVALEYDRHALTFLRWNGGGDLFPESVTAINHLGQARPDMTIWVVTRIPEFAALIREAPGVYVHFSLDRHSLTRRREFLRRAPKTTKYFFSYQCDRAEQPSLENLQDVRVLFFDNYEPTLELSELPNGIACPLNQAKDISGVCESCRRCFSPFNQMPSPPKR
jgi:hypothetical protein